MRDSPKITVNRITASSFCASVLTSKRNTIHRVSILFVSTWLAGQNCGELILWSISATSLPHNLLMKCPVCRQLLLIFSKQISKYVYFADWHMNSFHPIDLELFPQSSLEAEWSASGPSPESGPKCEHYCHGWHNISGTKHSSCSYLSDFSILLPLAFYLFSLKWCPFLMMFREVGHLLHKAHLCWYR